MSANVSSIGESKRLAVIGASLALIFAVILI